MPDPKTILILGCGVGGVATARALRKRLPHERRIVLVDRVWFEKSWLYTQL